MKSAVLLVSITWELSTFFYKGMQITNYDTKFRSQTMHDPLLEQCILCFAINISNKVKL